ncbi:MAG: AbrB/MazE/SpoVT family DNA-binding domain-containing protein [Desulfobulbaceae bacterium]|nr:AbrB/MazE/SpoVT family DNA-binding domain-containing protein [Desulfobulbaceae bacterium]
MKALIVKIGNSHGIRIPKPLLDQCGLEGEVELEVQNNSLLIKARKQTRKNWESAFKKMSKNNDDQLIETIPSDWENGEWEW